MEFLIRKGRDLVCGTHKNALSKFDESGPLFQPRPKASHDEGPSSGSLNVSTHDEVEVKDGNLDDLWEHISELWKIREVWNVRLKENDRQVSCLNFQYQYGWPNNPAWQDLKGIVLGVADPAITNIDEAVKSILTRVKVAIVAPNVVAFALEETLIHLINRGAEVSDLTRIMYDLAILLKRLSESPGRMQDVMQEATSRIVKGARVFFLVGGLLAGGRHRSAISTFRAVSTIKAELDAMYLDIITQFTARVFTPIPHPWRSHLSEKYRTHAVEVKDGNLDDLWEHIFALWKLRNKGKHNEARCVGPCTWPHVPGLDKLIQFVSIGTDLPIQEIDGTVKAILDEIGRENAATAAPLVVSHTLERLDDPYTHTEEFWHLVTEMYELAIVLKILREIPEETRQDATALIVEGARVFSLEGGPRRSASKVPAISDKLKTMKRNINTQFTVRVLPCIQHQLRSHHSKEYTAYAEKVKDVNFDGFFNFAKEVKDVNLDDLWEHIFEVWKLREKGNHDRARSVRDFRWPDLPRLQDLKKILLPTADNPITYIDIHVKPILERVNVATVAPLVVAHTLKRLDASITNKDELWHLVEVMYDLAIVIEELNESSRRAQEVMQEAKSLIVEGARVFSLQGDPRRSASEAGAGAMVQLLHDMYIRIKAEFTFPFLTPIQPRRGSYLSKNYLKHAVFKMEALEVATNNFHKDNKVGEGGVGAVYKGTTHHGKQIAVKKMSLTSNQGRKQFMNEKLLAKVKHPNLVKLRGFCEQESQGFIVYKYLPKGSLDKFLFDPEKRKELDWHIRYNIILGIACGLCYLHEYSQPRIVHRDIKTSNILLDDELIPKIADFGTANVLPEDWTHVTVTTRSRVGTYGYMPLEYIYTGRLSVRNDVYSFGIVLLELLTGEKISSDAFLERVWSSYKSKKVADTIDRTITETWDKDKGKAKALRCLQVGLLCIQKEAELRPTMSQVITMLSSSESLPVPTKPLLFSSRRRSCF